MPTRHASKEDLDRERDKLLHWLIGGAPHWNKARTEWDAAVRLHADLDTKSYRSHVAPILGDPSIGEEAWGKTPEENTAVVSTVLYALEALLHFLPQPIANEWLRRRAPGPGGIIVVGDGVDLAKLLQASGQKKESRKKGEGT
ncbi:MAG: hypothetical protein KGJ23_07775 [Euryarchaeota archaeon]|nr:hypothetical protein [Euryarchaeota archaeon]MDE1836498.1 hypothetical protein [Euryarchaeota archaeon]MDE1879307.1 hypothetical protein [Euryarchaeota archaeon]MDE2044468.1 hypothetical protein [Thermoplasmata archaeon]